MFKRTVCIYQNLLCCNVWRSGKSCNVVLISNVANYEKEHTSQSENIQTILCCFVAERKLGGNMYKYYILFSCFPHFDIVIK